MVENELVALRRTRGTYKTRLTHFEAFIERFRDSGDPVEILKTRIEFVQNAWSGLDAIQARIEELDENDEERVELDERYCALVDKARAIVNSARRSVTATSSDRSEARKCVYCQEESHAIYFCTKFQALEVPKRHEVVKERRLCRYCLRGNHLAAKCIATHCRKCGGKHNTLLHSDEQPAAKKPPTTSDGSSEKEQTLS